ncbi:MAG: pantoate--beta-alanine ligase [Leptospiraceae bacterium]|nr:pantoate--beta-alanine ligase [Leptospiraceae bacterium]
MKTSPLITTRAELRQFLKQWRQAQPDGIVGLVPTMGYLHAGHRALLEAARQASDLLICSIFVNPLQFNDSADFNNYPKSITQDRELCQTSGVDLIFAPPAEEMYSTKPLLQLAMPDLTGNLCGPGRPGHFEGVLMVVARLFHLCQPDKAWFGKKDYQQLLVIRQLAQDLDMNITIIGLPTVREASGLAMSSRNAHLSPRGREHASLIYRSLELARKEFLDGCTNAAELIEICKDVIQSGTLNRVEYLEIVDARSLAPLSRLQSDSHFVIATAVFCEQTRLIDNIEILSHPDPEANSL